jgi:quercetin dioxygenase-like cupin family protein
MKLLYFLGIVMFSFFAQAHESTSSIIKPQFKYSIANVPGTNLTGILVTYPPGGKSSPHRHGNSFIIAYVLEGEIRSQVEGERVRVYRAGESWVEKPNAHHIVSENALKDRPSKILAIFVSNEQQKDLVIPDTSEKDSVSFRQSTLGTRFFKLTAATGTSCAGEANVSTAPFIFRRVDGVDSMTMDNATIEFRRRNLAYMGDA